MEPKDPRSARHGLSSTPPFYKIDWKEDTIEPRPPLAERDRDTIFGVMKEAGITGLNAGGQMTDGVLERLWQLDQLTRLNLSGSRRVTDAGLRHLGHLPQLQHLELTGCRISDAGLEVLGQLRGLRGTSGPGTRSPMADSRCCISFRFSRPGAAVKQDFR